MPGSRFARAGMTMEDTPSRSRDSFFPSFAINLAPKGRAQRDPPRRGRGECRVSDAPVVWAKNARVVPQVHRSQPAFPAQWFYGFLRALPGDRALLPPSSVRGVSFSRT